MGDYLPSSPGLHKNPLNNLGPNQNLNKTRHPRRLKNSPQRLSKYSFIFKGIKKGVLDKGDHVCTLRIKVPTNLTQKQREIFMELAKEEKEEREEKSY